MRDFHAHQDTVLVLGDIDVIKFSLFVGYNIV